MKPRQIAGQVSGFSRPDALSPRMVWLVPAIVLLLEAVTAQSVEAQTLTIDFDTDADGLPVPHGTIVNTVYQAQGVLLEHVGPGAACGNGPEVFASQNCLQRGAPSPPNVVTLCGASTCSDISESGFGVIRANLAPQRNKCVSTLFRWKSATPASCMLSMPTRSS